MEARAGNGVGVVSDERKLTPAEATREVYDLMAKNKVSLYDLELLGHIDDIANWQDADDPDLLHSVEETFNRACGEIDLNGGGSVADYYTATQEYVGAELRRLGLLWAKDADDELDDDEEFFPCGWEGCNWGATANEDELIAHMWEKHAVRAS